MHKLIMFVVTAAMVSVPLNVLPAQAGGSWHTCPPGFVWTLHGYYTAGCERVAFTATGTDSTGVALSSKPPSLGHGCRTDHIRAYAGRTVPL